MITGGTNTGVMKHVGEALQGASKLSSGAEGRNRVYCIGIATWGIVDHRELLVKPGVWIVLITVRSDPSCVFLLKPE